MSLRVWLEPEGVSLECPVKVSQQTYLNGRDVSLDPSLRKIIWVQEEEFVRGRRGGKVQEEDRHSSISGLGFWRGKNLEQGSPQLPLLALPLGLCVTGHTTSSPGHSDVSQRSVEAPGLSRSSPTSESFTYWGCT